MVDARRLVSDFVESLTNLVRDADVGAGERGPVTEKIQSAFFDIVNGRNAKYAKWLAKV